MMHQFHKDEQGFSLVEMIIAFALLGMVSLMIVGFIMTGTKSYSRQNAEVNVQTEAQLTLNQLSDRIIDTSRALAYKATPEGGLLTVFNSDEIYLVRWEKEERRLYAASMAGDFSHIEDATNIDLSGVKWSVMAEYIENFSVDADQVKEKGQIYITLSLKEKGQTYETTGHITLRNDLLINEKNIQIIYPNGPVDVESTITGVTVRIGTRTLNAGGTTPISAKVSGTGYPKQDVIWRLEGNTSSMTSVQQDNLVIGADENAELIVVTATSVADMSKSATVNVSIKGVKSVSISPSEAKLKPGDRQAFTAVVTGLNLDDNAASADQAVIWTMNLSEGSDIRADLSSGGILTIDNDSGIRGSITVTATSYMNRTASASAVINLEPKSYEGIKLTADKAVINRGGSASLEAEVQGGDGNPSIVWSAVAKNSAGAETTEGIEIDNNGHLTVGDSLNYDYQYTVTVTAALRNTDKSASVDLIVPKVTLNVTPKVAVVQRSAGMPAWADLKCSVTGLENYDVEWAIARQTNPDYFRSYFGTGTAITGNVQKGAVVTIGGGEKNYMNLFYVRAQLKGNPAYRSQGTLTVEYIYPAGLRTENGETTIKMGSGATPHRLTTIIFTLPEGYEASQTTVTWRISVGGGAAVSIPYQAGGYRFNGSKKNMIAGFDNLQDVTRMYYGTANDVTNGRKVDIQAEVSSKNMGAKKYTLTLTIVK